MDDLQRKLKRTADELEQGSRGLRPGRSAPKLRYGVAGLGMAACIAAALVLFTQLLPSESPKGLGTESGSVGSPAPSHVEPDEQPDAPAPTPPDSKPAVPAPSEAPTPSRAPSTGPTPSDSPCGEIVDGPEAAPEGIKISASWAKEGDGVRLTARFKNERVTPVQNHEGNPRVVWIVQDEQFRIVWDSTWGKVYTQELRTVDYAPGEEASVSEFWDLRTCGPDGSAGPKLGAGTYQIFAVWTGEFGGEGAADPLVLP